jgi:Ni/Fe-hydrogenase subunit HybB-like protein
LLSAITIGYGIVLFESCVAAAAYRREIEMHLLQPMAKVMLGVLAVFVALRAGDLIVRGALGHAFAPSLEAFFFWLEIGCFLLPFLLIGSQSARRNPAMLFLAGCSIMMGGILMRINGFLIGYDTGLGVDHGWNYFPSIAEMLVTIGMFAVEILAYIIITRRFPVLPREEAQAAH